jgi:hypothetical protein
LHSCFLKIFAVLIGINIVRPTVGYRLVSVLSIIRVLATLVGIFVCGYQSG